MNVVANLLAAAIIYLGGAWFGLFPSSTPAILAASGVLVLVALLALMAWLGAGDRRKRPITRLVAFAVLMAVISGLATSNIALPGGLRLGVVAVCGALGFAALIASLVLSVRQLRGREPG